MLTALLNRACQTNPSRAAIVHGGERITYAQLATLVERMADLFAGHGIGLGIGLGTGTGTGNLIKTGIGQSQSVAFILPNCPEFVICFFACARLNVIALPLSPQYTQEEVSRLLADSGASLVVTDSAHLPLVQAALEEIGQASDKETRKEATAKKTAVPLIIVEPGTFAHDAVLSATDKTDKTDNQLLPVSTEPFAGPALYLYTSGSTDSYKRVTCTQQNLYFEALNFVEATGLGCSDTIICTVPLYHSYGIGNCMLDAVFAGATLVLLGEFTEVPFAACARDVLKIIQREEVKFFPGVPHQFSVLASLSDGKPADLAGLRLCVSSGDVLLRSTFNSFLQRYGKPIRSLYGSTEAGSIAMNIAADEAVEFGSLGPPLPNVVVEIRDQSKNILPAGEAGHIWVKSPVIPPTGYDNRESLSSEIFCQGFYDSGDVGLLDPAGHLVMQGRKQSFVDVAGYKVDISEVEEVLNEHPLVVEAAALGVLVPNMGNLVKAVLVTRERLSETEIRKWCRERLAFFKIPRLIEFLPSLPRSPIGKIVKKDLADISLWLSAISATPGELGLKLEQASADSGRTLLTEFVRGQIALVLGKPVNTIALRQGFTELGMDSLSSLELCARLEYALGRNLPSTIAFDHPTVVALTEALLPHPTDATAKTQVADHSLDDLSSEELTRLLANELRNHS